MCRASWSRSGSTRTRNFGSRSRLGYRRTMRHRPNPTRWTGPRFGRSWRRCFSTVLGFALGLFVLGWLVWALAGLYVEYAWFESLGYADVVLRRIAAQVALFLGGTALFGLLYWASLRQTRERRRGRCRCRPGGDLGLPGAVVSAGLGEDGVRARRADGAWSSSGPCWRWLRAGAADGWSAGWRRCKSSRSRVADPLFGRDAGFYGLRTAGVAGGARLAVRGAARRLLTTLRRTSCGRRSTSGFRPDGAAVAGAPGADAPGGARGGAVRAAGDPSTNFR